MAIEQEIGRVADALFEIAAALRIDTQPLPQPQPFKSVRLLSERRENDMDLLTFEAMFPSVPSGTDVAKQVFTVTANGEEVLSDELESSVASGTFEVPQGADVTLSLVYLDDGGNRSEPRTQSFVAADTIPPSAPGAFGEVRLVSERTVPDSP